MDLLSTAEAAAAPQLRNRGDIDDRYKWNLNDIFSGLGRVAARLRRARTARSARTPRSRARSRRARDRLLAALQLSDEIGQLDVQGLVFRVAEVRRGSARQPDQRAAPAGADPVRQGRRRPAPGSIPNCWRSRSPTVQQWMARRAELARLPLRDRRPLSPAGARARRKGRAPAVARRAASRRRRTTPTPRCRPPTSSIRRSRCRPARR